MQYFLSTIIILLYFYSREGNTKNYSEGGRHAEKKSEYGGRGHAIFKLHSSKPYQPSIFASLLRECSLSLGLSIDVRCIVVIRKQLLTTVSVKKGQDIYMHLACSRLSRYPLILTSALMHFPLTVYHQAVDN